MSGLRDLEPSYLEPATDIERLNFHGSISEIAPEQNDTAVQVIYYPDGQSKENDRHLNITSLDNQPVSDCMIATYPDNLTPLYRQRDCSLKLIMHRYVDHPEIRALEAMSDQHYLNAPSADPLKNYLNKVASYTRLTPAQEAVLFSELDKGIDVFNLQPADESITHEQNTVLLETAKAHTTILLSNLKLVVHIAKKYQHLNMPLIDLIQEGNLGLIKSIARFDIRKGFKFSTYAYFWISQTIIRAINDRFGLIHIPDVPRKAWTDLERSTLSLKTILGRTATETEVAVETGKSVEEIKKLSIGHLRFDSLNPYPDDEMPALADVLVDYAGDDFNGENPQLLDIDELNQLFRDNENTSVRDKIILSMRYGVYIRALAGTTVTVAGGQTKSYEELMQTIPPDSYLTLENIGKIFNVTNERIRQIQIKTLRALNDQATKFSMEAGPHNAR